MCEGVCVRVCEKVSAHLWMFVYVCVCVQRPCACIDLNWVSPRVQSHLISLYDYVIKTVSLISK